VVDKIAQMRRISAQLSNDLGHEPTEGELSEELGIAAEELARLKRVGLRRESLDAFVGGDDMTEFWGKRSRRTGANGRSNCSASNISPIRSADFSRR
jgi:DNA-directed RNA polymerase sigma subunit (sigma70/sigma32)